MKPGKCASPLNQAAFGEKHPFDDNGAGMKDACNWLMGRQKTAQEMTRLVMLPSLNLFEIVF
jgi:hypothetical protein